MVGDDLLQRLLGALPQLGNPVVGPGPLHVIDLVELALPNELQLLEGVALANPLAVGEFVLVYILAHVLKVGLTNVEAVLLYWIAWTIAIWTKVAILPLLSLSWIENAGEFRSTDWAIAPEYQPLPVSVFQPPDATSPVPRLAREFSSVHRVPAELRELPSPSGVHRVPGPR